MIDKAKDKPKNEYEASQAALMRAIGFSEDDLEANRDAVLSPNQKIYLARRRGIVVGVTIAIVAVIGFVVGIFLISDLMSQKVGFGVVATVIGILGLTPFILRRYRSTGVARLNQVTDIQGRVQLDLDSRRHYFLRISDLTFEVNKSVFLAFKNGDPYVIYYTPRGKIILSAEWLREGDG